MGTYPVKGGQSPFFSVQSLFRENESGKNDSDPFFTPLLLIKTGVAKPRDYIWSSEAKLRDYNAELRPATPYDLGKE